MLADDFSFPKRVVNDGDVGIWCSPGNNVFVSISFVIFRFLWSFFLVVRRGRSADLVRGPGSVGSV